MTLSATSPRRAHSLLGLPSLLFWSTLMRLQRFRDNRRKNRRSVDTPQLAPGLALHDVSFHSTALGRETTYRAILPADVRTDVRLPVVYLLHAAGDDYLGWSNDSTVAQFAARGGTEGLVLVMPDGAMSHFANPIAGPRENYADYITNDLRLDVEARFPAATSRTGRAIVGISMGGFGALHIALGNPHLYSFIGGISSALNIVEPETALRKLPGRLMRSRIVGRAGSTHHRRVNPFYLARALSAVSSPYVYLTCSAGEHLIDCNRRFDALLTELGLPHEFHVVTGGHDWWQWNAQMPALFATLREYVSAETVPAVTSIR